MKQRAFTLIELLITVTIIAIIGIASISGFSHMTEVQDAETTMKSVSNALDSFDQSISRHEITSYDAVFTSGSIGFAANLDWYKKNPQIQYSFDFTTGSGLVWRTDTGTGIVGLNFAAQDTVWQSSALSLTDGKKTFSFPKGIEKKWYQISSAIDDTLLNSYMMQYYNLTNTQESQEKEVRLTKIIGGDNVPYTSLLIRNVLGKKTLQGSGATIGSLEQATLTFEKNGKEMEIILSK